MKRICFLLFVFASAVAFACSSKKTVVREYAGVPSYKEIEDSIEASGTTMSSYRWTVFRLDDGRTDSVRYATLYKDASATGSIQVRELPDGSFDVIIIDVIKEEK